MGRSVAKEHLLTKLMLRLQELDDGKLTTNQPRKYRARLKARIDALEAEGIRPRGYGADRVT